MLEYLKDTFYHDDSKKCAELRSNLARSFDMLGRENPSGLGLSLHLTSRIILFKRHEVPSILVNQVLSICRMPTRLYSTAAAKQKKIERTRTTGVTTLSDSEKYVLNAGSANVGKGGSIEQAVGTGNGCIR